MNIYIYGAGAYGKQCYEKLHSLGIEAKAFIVSEQGDNPFYVYDIPVVEIKSLKTDRTDAIIFLALKEKSRKEVLPALLKFGYRYIIECSFKNYKSSINFLDSEILQLRDLARDLAYKLNERSFNNSSNEKSKLYEKNIDFSNCRTDIKALALYLPQFHTFKENDEWWGKGFTEWTNVKKGRPRFIGHNQPRIPDPSFGYYNLLDPDIFCKQVCLAKEHGIYGFAFYFYWFSGKKLMEQPLDLYLAHKELDFPFLFIWANENWTRRWDGHDDDILIKQEYDLKDPVNLVTDLKKYIDDKRYIRISGKPVVCIYKPDAIPDIQEFITIFRKTARETGIGDVLLWSCMGRGELTELGLDNLFDGQYEFPPLNMSLKTVARPYDGVSKSYNDFVDKIKNFETEHRKITVKTYRGTMLEWDCSARKEYNYWCFDGFSSEKFYVANKIIIDYTRRKFEEKNRFIFINAWNEWGEGTYLEPDVKYGYANINALSKALFDKPFSKMAIRYIGTAKNSIAVRNKWLKENTKIAVHAHVFYEELIAEIVEKTNNIPYPFNLFITTDTDAKKNILEEYVKHFSHAQQYFIAITDNRGRDVYPFITQLKPIYTEYNFICHIHTKKSLQNQYGSTWRNYLYENLLGNEDIIADILDIFLNETDVGFISPENIDFVHNQIEWGGNKANCDRLMLRLNKDFKITSAPPSFPAGNMFWARSEAIKKIFNVNFSQSEFEDEKGQVDGTLAHAIERIWFYLVESEGYRSVTTRCLTDSRPLFQSM